MVAPLIGMAARAAAKKAAEKIAKAKAKAKPEDKMLDGAIVGLSGAKAAGATGMAMREEGRRAEKKEGGSKDAAETKREAQNKKAGGKVIKMARGGGIEIRGKTKCKMR